LPLPRPLRTAIHDIRSVDTVLVELHGDGGAIGSGYCSAFGERRARALQVLVEDLAPIYEGQDATATRALFDRAWRSISARPTRRPCPLTSSWRPQARSWRPRQTV
jgi:L-alanine-DL-glutamate epimerase-like enolase superfamily enzyme